MLDSGFMAPCILRLSDRNMHGGGCVVATWDKTTVFLSTDENYCLHCVLFYGGTPLVKLWPPIHFSSLITTSLTCFSSSLARWYVYLSSLQHIRYV